MAALAGHKRVEFDVQAPGAYAVQLRLTPALLEALLRAQEAGQGASIRFGDAPQANAISVGDAAFRFNALPEETCDLLRLPSAGNSSSPAGPYPAIVGAVRQKLMVQRNIQDERERVRARAEEAERKGSERKAQLLDKKPAVGAAKRGPTTTVTMQRGTPPPPAVGSQHRGQTPPPPRQQVTAGMLAAPAGRPPTHPGNAALAGRSATPPPATAGAGSKPMHKSASAGKLGQLSKGSTGSLGGQAANPLVLQAARSSASLRLVVIAILAERPMALSTIKAVLTDVASKLKSFKVPNKEELARTVKAVAEFKTPGMYVVYSMLLKELDELMPAGSSEAAPSGRSPSPQHGSPSGHSVEAAPAGAAKGGGKKSTKKAAAAAAPAAAGDGGGSGAVSGSGARKAVASGKRSRLDWTDDDSSDAELPPAQRPRQQQAAALPAAAAQRQAMASAPASLAAAAAASPPSVGGGPAGGSSSSGGLAAGAPGGPLQRRTSSSRGSDKADDSWIEEHADRQPQPAAPITTKEEYRQREAAFNAKYDSYFALHQLIEAHKKDFEALHAAAAAASSEAEREQHRAELQRLHQRRGERAKRWDAAYRVLHRELSAAKARMSEFVQQLQRQQQPLPGAAAAVRVK